MIRILVPLLAMLLAVCSPAQPPAPADGSGGTTPMQSRATARVPSRLRIEGTQFRTAEGERFLWRGLSAFRLAEFIAHGREAEAVALLDWAAAQRLTVVRAFVMARHLFQLKPDEGLRSLPRLLDLAAERGLYVEVVALADTAETGIDFAQHVKAVGSIAAAHANALVEIANEPWHPTQDPYLHDPANVGKLAELVPRDIPVAFGSAESNDGYARGTYVTWHSPRHSGEEGWQHVRSISDAAVLVGTWQKPAVSDEPIGAGPALVPGRRDDNASRFGAAAAVTRLVGLGATFHYEAGLHARVPTGPELACFSAWSSTLDLLKDLPEGGRFVAGADLEKMATLTGARTAYGREYANEAWVVAVDPREHASMTWKEGWRQHTSRGGSGVRLFHARR